MEQFEKDSSSGSAYMDWRRSLLQIKISEYSFSRIKTTKACLSSLLKPFGRGMEQLGSSSGS